MPDNKQMASARAFGESLRRNISAGIDAAAAPMRDGAAATFPILGSIANAVSPFVTTQPGREQARAFIEGAIGAPPGGGPVKVANTPAANPPTNNKSGTTPRVVGVEDFVLSPEDWARARATKMLASPNSTLGQLQAAMGMIPAPMKPATGKDRMYDAVLQSNKELFAARVAQAEALKATDMEGAKALTDAATKEYLQNYLTALGASPLENALADAQNQH